MSVEKITAHKFAQPKPAASKITFGPKRTQRFNSLYHWYGEKGKDILGMLPNRGRNCYDQFIYRANLVNNSSGQSRNYYQSLTEAFTGEHPYKAEEVTRIVSAVRSRYGLDPFVGNLKTQCLGEFFKAYFVVDAMATGTPKGHRVFVAKFKMLGD